jgi:hypothetical protein
MYHQRTLCVKEDLQAKRGQFERVECCRPEAQWQLKIVVDSKGTTV